MIATANIGCQAHLASGTSRPVRHWIELLDDEDARTRGTRESRTAVGAVRHRARGGGASRDDYRHFLAIPTRWMDNDSYGHVNNVTYYSYFDTAVNEHLIRAGGLDIARDPVIGIVVETALHVPPLARVSGRDRRRACA